jgi:hypothetical protein
MLFSSRFWPGILDGSVTLTFRRWRRVQARPGGQYRTGAGLIEVLSVERATSQAISASEAVRAGYPSPEALWQELDRYPNGDLYRIEFRRVGADPREVLRSADALTAEDRAALEQRLIRLDAASTHGPWTLAVLRLIEARPGERAVGLAAAMGLERDVFKRDVRKLKELGLTESLEVGYRLSPRGIKLLRLLEADSVDGRP